MFNKRGFLFLFLLIIVIGTASSVSASDLDADAVSDSNLDKMEINDNNDIIEEVTDESDSNKLSEINVEDEVISTSDDDVLQVSGRPISELQSLIDKASPGSKISLRFDYYCDENSNYFGVNIDKCLTIDGNGHTIDAQKYSRIFNISGSNVVLNDLTFKNGQVLRYVQTSSTSWVEIGPMGSMGGCIYAYDGMLTINNCNFYNNTADYNGGAIVTSGGLNINNCSFVNNYAYGIDTEVNVPGSSIPVKTSAYGLGGAIYAFSPLYEDQYINITDTTFGNNGARAGAAVYLDYSGRSYMDSSYLILSFMKNVGAYYNYAVYGGGAVYSCQYLEISDSGFVGNQAGGSGGAICLQNGWYTEDMYMYNRPVYLVIHGQSAFAYNEAQYSGGAIFHSYSDSGLQGDLGFVYVYDDVIFDGNHASTNGGAIYVNDIECVVLDATFANNEAGKTAGAIYGGNTIDCKFDGNSNPQTYNTSMFNRANIAIKQSGSYFNNKALTVTLTGNDGSVIANQYVNLCINGKTTKVKTNSKGQATFKVSLPAKKYAATISFDGAGKYLSASKNTTVTIKKATPKITAYAKTFKAKTKTKLYTITLKNNLGKVMKSTNVKITVNGKTYSAKTNSKGQATFKITKLTKKGIFKSTVKYAGSSYYNAVNKKVTITVKK